ncbi:MAG: UbiX family flavin prenyltransferase [Bacillaceae bacterium]|nr:UbiX family flavin prenyltransferase [Bacillaceae bacterium]
MVNKIFSVGITGASGVIYGIRLVQELLRANYTIHLIITDAGWQVIHQEIQFETGDPQNFIHHFFPSELGGRIHYHSLQDFNAPIASGSYRSEGMVVIPCSMGTLSSIAHGSSSTLLERAADVTLKEGRSLLLIPRETPLNQIHLENMLRVSKVGGKIIPAMPGFYQLPTTIDDLINFVVGKVLDYIGVEHHLFTRWGD